MFSRTKLMNINIKCTLLCPNVQKCAFKLPRKTNLAKVLCLVEFRIDYTGVVCCLQLFYQNRLGIGYVAEGDGAVAEIPVTHLSVDNLFNE